MNQPSLVREHRPKIIARTLTLPASASPIAKDLVAPMARGIVDVLVARILTVLMADIMVPCVAVVLIVLVVVEFDDVWILDFM